MILYRNTGEETVTRHRLKNDSPGMYTDPVGESVQPKATYKRIRLILLLLAGFTVASFITVIVAVRKGYVITEYAGPLAIPLQLSANFAEIRPDHFHMGLDIRTKGHEDMPVRAVTAGYVSRVGVSADGYGNVIYIRHAGNRTSVYAHLNQFYPALQKFVLAKQQASGSWEQDLLFDPGAFPVTKGMFIANSGNTGHSEGPHLHFEWRNTATGASLNPQPELFRLYDDVAPVIEDVYVYDRSTTGVPQQLEHIAAAAITPGSAVTVTSPLVSIGITAIDKMTGSQFNMGVYTAKLFVDDKLVYEFRRDQVSVDDNREINARIDYEAWFHRQIISEHLFKTALGGESPEGLVVLRDGLVHHLKITATDLEQNERSVEFDLKYRKPAEAGDRRSPNVFAAKASTISAGSLTGHATFVTFGIPAKAVFYDQYLIPKIIPSADPGNLSGKIMFTDGSVPLRDSVTVSVRPSKMPEQNRAQAVLQVRNANFYDVVKGTWHGDRYIAKVGNTGTISLLTDTIAPVIGLSGWRNQGRIGPGDEIRLVISDNLQKIVLFRAEIDGTWTPFARKGNRFRFKPAADTPRGVHKLVITVDDMAGNRTRNTFHFEY